MQTGWHCARCSNRDDGSILWYQDGIFNAHSKRFDPRCAQCGTPVVFDPDRVAPGVKRNAPVLVLAGSCASGKSTVSYLLSERYGFVQIDEDWIRQKWKVEQGHKVDFSAIPPYLLNMADGLTRLGKPVVLAHILTPESMPCYERFLGARDIPYRIVILMPDRDTLLHRNVTRVCWPKTTPEYWVLKFRQDYLDGPEAVRACFYDNGNESPEETARALRDLVFCS